MNGGQGTCRTCRRGMWYNMQYINMSGKLPMCRRGENAKVRYSAAYPTDAPEKALFVNG